jgi:hypothetical protein
MIRWLSGRDARPLELRIRVNPRLLELQTAKEMMQRSFMLGLTRWRDDPEQAGGEMLEGRAQLA